MESSRDLVGTPDELSENPISQRIPSDSLWNVSKKFLPISKNGKTIKKYLFLLQTWCNSKVKDKNSESSPKRALKRNTSFSQFVRKKNISAQEKFLNIPSFLMKPFNNDNQKLNEPSGRNLPRKLLSWLVPDSLTKALRSFNNNEEKEMEMPNEYQVNIIGDRSHNLYEEQEIEKNDSGSSYFSHSLKKYFPVIHPEGRLKLGWNIFICLCILFQFFVITIELFFDKNWDTVSDDIKHSNMYISQVLKYMILLDTIFNVFTGYFFQGTVVMNPYSIIQHYFKNILIVDLLAIFPIFFEFTEHESEDEHKSAFYTSGTSFIKLLFVFRLVKLKRTFYYIEIILSNNEKIEGVLSLFKLSFKILFTAHLFACIWYFLGDYSRIHNQPSWLNKAFESPEVNDWRTFYLYSLYWSITTMITVGYGDITPANNPEIGFSICSMIIGCGLFGYSLSNIGIIFEKFSSQRGEIKTNLKIINSYMKRKEIEFTLQGKVRGYLDYILRESQRENTAKELELINKLSIPLKRELLSQANGKVLQSCLFLKNNFSAKTVQKLSELLVPLSLAPGDFIFEENSRNCDGLYFISKGSVDIYMGRDTEKKTYSSKLKSLGADDVFGEYSFITSRPREYSAVSVGYTKVFILQKSKFLDILQEDPLEYEIFCKIRDTLLLYGDLSLSKSKCFSCEDSNHSILSCPLLLYLPDKATIIQEFRNKKKTNQRKKLNRHLNRAAHPLLTMQSLLLAKEMFSEEYDLDEYTRYIEKLKQECMSLNSMVFKENDTEDNKLPELKVLGKKETLDRHFQSMNTNLSLEHDQHSPLSPPKKQSKNNSNLTTDLLRFPSSNLEKELTPGVAPHNSNALIEPSQVRIFSPQGDNFKLSFWEQSRNLMRQHSKTRRLKSLISHSESEEKKVSEDASTLSKQNIKTKRESNDVSLFDFSFDVGKNYRLYFPHNNPQTVVIKARKGIAFAVDGSFNKKEKSHRKSERLSISVGQAPINLPKKRSLWKN